MLQWPTKTLSSSPLAGRPDSHHKARKFITPRKYVFPQCFLHFFLSSCFCGIPRAVGHWNTPSSCDFPILPCPSGRKMTFSCPRECSAAPSPLGRVPPMPHEHQPEYNTTIRTGPPSLSLAAVTSHILHTRRCKHTLTRRRPHAIYIFSIASWFLQVLLPTVAIQHPTSIITISQAGVARNSVYLFLYVC